ncbi:LysR family transcriptional regulator [Acinetobacter johnsonii]|uniref:LysR family transcriptional regulator n=1 Tax=Acinetobacter johnsonii TaxID=40214 RepID=UPI003F57CFEB
MELRNIQYFIAIAEEQSFSKAALRLGISQPPLSMQIKKLEREIGVELFYRYSHGVALTPAGETFLKMVLPVQNQLKNAVKLTQSTANGELGELRLGFTGTSILNSLIPTAIQAFQQQYPQVNLVLKEANSLILIESLLNNELDIAIVRPPAQYPKAITIRNLIDEKLIAALPIQYPAEDEVIDLAEFKHESFIVSPPEVSAGLYAAILNSCQQHGFTPKIGQQAPQIVSILSLVAANLGVSLVPESTQQLKIEGIKYKYLKNKTATIGLGIAFKADLHSQPAINFSSLLNSIVRQHHHLKGSL